VAVAVVVVASGSSTAGQSWLGHATMPGAIERVVVSHRSGSGSRHDRLNEVSVRTVHSIVAEHDERLAPQGAMPGRHRGHPHVVVLGQLLRLAAAAEAVAAIAIRARATLGGDTERCFTGAGARRGRGIARGHALGCSVTTIVVTTIIRNGVIS